MRHLVRDNPAASNASTYALRIVRASRPAAKQTMACPGRCGSG